MTQQDSSDIHESERSGSAHGAANGAGRQRLLLFGGLAVVVVLVGVLGAKLLSGGDVTVEGQIESTHIYSHHLDASMGIPDPTCGWHKVEVSDGSGTILQVGRSVLVSQQLKGRGGARTLICTSKYSFSVPDSAVYTVSLPGTDKLDVAGATEKTVNKTGSTVKVEDISFMYLNTIG